MTKTLLALVTVFALGTVAAPAFAGDTKTTTETTDQTSADGSKTKHSKKTTKQNADGSTTKSEETSKTQTK